MNKKLSAIFNEVPPKPDHNPVRKAIENSQDRADVAAALKLFASMPPSTGVLANPVRYHHEVPASGTNIQLDIRSFTVRGKLFEEDIITGAADAVRVVFVGLFGRVPANGEARLLANFIAGSFESGVEHSLTKVAGFMKTLSGASPDIVMQHWASYRKANRSVGQVNMARPADALLAEMIEIHMENVAVAGIASYMRGLSASDRVKGTR